MANKNVLTVRPDSLPLPKGKDIKPVSAIAGKNPTSYNLRDHPELNGMDFISVGCIFKQGIIEDELTDYVLIFGYTVAKDQTEPNPDNKAVIITGSENLFSRMAVIESEKGFPCRGTLRNEGRAWFYD